MNFASFLTYIAIKQHVSVTADSTMLQTLHDHKHTDKDPASSYAVLSVTIKDSFSRAHVIYSRTTFNGVDSFKLINCDIVFVNFEGDHPRLFIHNATVSKLIEHFS